MFYVTFNLPVISRPGLDESSLGAYWIAKVAKFLHADKKNSNQTARMRRLTGVFTGGSYQKVRYFHVVAQICINSGSLSNE